jgi:hypothetical protein
MNRRQFLLIPGLAGLTLLPGCKTMDGMGAGLESALNEVLSGKPKTGGNGSAEAMDLFRRLDSGQPVAMSSVNALLSPLIQSYETGKTNYSALWAAGQGRTVDEMVATVGEPFVAGVRHFVLTGRQS